MNTNKRAILCFHSGKVVLMLSMILILGLQLCQAQSNSSSAAATAVHPICALSNTDTVFIPVDSWVYPAILRLYSLGYLHSVFIGERPWTRASIGKMLGEVADSLDETRNYNNPTLTEAEKTYDALVREIKYDPAQKCLIREENLHFECQAGIPIPLKAISLQRSRARIPAILYADSD